MNQTTSSDLPITNRSAAVGPASAWLIGGALVLASALGCGTTSDGAPVPPTASGSAAATAAPTGGKLPDLTKEFTTGQCEEIQGSAVPGADSYFHGNFTLSDEVARGHETWWLAANKAWTTAGGNSCTIQWTVIGTKVATGACIDCDFGLKLSATPDIRSSKCPEQLVKREARPQELGYDIKLSASGEAFIYYSKSGNLLGQGFHADGNIVWRTQHQCKWF